VRSFRARGPPHLLALFRQARLRVARSRARARQAETASLAFRSLARSIRLAESEAGGGEAGTLRFFHESMPARFTIRAASAARYFVSISLSLTTARYSALCRRLKRARVAFIRAGDLGRSFKASASVFQYFFSFFLLSLANRARRSTLASEARRSQNRRGAVCANKTSTNYKQGCISSAQRFVR